MKTLAAILLSILMLIPHGPSVPQRDQAGANVGGFASVCVTGEPIDGSVFGGFEASIVVYWATWSEQSVRQLGLLDEISRQHPEYGVMGLLHTDATSTAEGALALMQELGYEFPVFPCDEVWEGIVSQAPYIPQCFIVDPEGTVVEAWQAAFTSSAAMLERLNFWAGGSSLPDGDFDMNGVVDSVDALLILRCSMGLEDHTEQQLAHADMNGSGELDSADALVVLRTALFPQ